MTTPLSSTVSACRVCGLAGIVPVLDLGRQPLANSLRRHRSEQLPTFPLVICRCDGCGTIQLSETVAPEILFKHYVWVTGTSEGARRYSHLFCDRLRSRCVPGPLSVLEVASNDGTFLKPFAEKGDRVLGVDPAQNIAAIAQQQGVSTEAEFFGHEVATRLVARDGLFNAVFARNVIPHVADVNDVVAGIAHCLKPDGTGAIEFHRTDVILRELHYDSIYHEHVCYHSLHSISRLLQPFQLLPFDVETSPISGGSFVVYFSRQPRPRTPALIEAIREEEELGIGQAAPWAEFARRCDRHRQALRGVVEMLKSDGKRLVGYGASARSSTMLNYCGIDHRHLDVVIDRATLKHDTFTPGTDIPIVTPEQAFALRPDAIVLLAWNFQDEILDQIRTEHRWQGQVVLPLPGDPRLIDFA